MKVSTFAIPVQIVIGEMPERSNGAVSKTVDLGNWIRGFESLSLRKKNESPFDFRFFVLNPLLLFLMKNAEII